MLSEEERMIKYVEEIVEDSINNIEGKDYFKYIMTMNDIQAIQGLLDLYNKEKKKSKILELAKIPYLEGEIMAYKEFFVSKDKIREQIKQIKSEEANIYFKEHVVYFLQELLEEE